MAAYNHWQMRTFQDLLDLTKAPDVLLDLTKASDVLQWLSPDPASSSNVLPSFDEMAPEVCEDQNDEALNFHRLSSKDSLSTSYSKASTVYSKGSSSRSPTPVRWADEKKIVSVFSRGSSM